MASNYQPQSRSRRIWFDTEFIEDGRTIELLSIGAVRDDGAMFYAEVEETDHSLASDWVKANVLPHMTGGPARQPKRWIAESLRNFAGERPEFWAYYGSYDWVALCQLYGTMMDLPAGWPKFCRDVKQLCVSLGDPKLPEQEQSEHHALADARWTRKAWEFLAQRSETEAPKDDRERLQFPFGFGDTLDVSHYKDEVHFEIDEPYAGDTESGIGRNSNATISRDNAIELARWILSRLSERGGYL